MKRAVFLILLLIWGLGCGPDVDGTWDVSGEFFPARTFSMVLRVDDGVVTADFSDENGQTRDIVVCDLHYNGDSGQVDFAFNPFSKTQDCASLQDVYLFRGSMGYAVIAGDLKDVNDKTVGRLRAVKRLE